jgi:hypothetical protein
MLSLEGRVREYWHAFPRGEGIASINMFQCLNMLYHNHIGLFITMQGTSRSISML